MIRIRGLGVKISECGQCGDLVYLSVEMDKKTAKKLYKALRSAASAQKRLKMKSAAATVGIFAAFGAVMYVKNRLVPKYADDYPYSFVWDGKHNGNLAFGDQTYTRVRGAKDLIKSQVSHYMTWDGRTIAESLVQLYLIPDDKKHFDRANTAVLLLQLYLCASLGLGRPARLKDITPEKALLLTMGFYACAPHLIATSFWLTGSMNYLWVGILQSLAVLPYSMHYHGRDLRLPDSMMFLAGLLSGWSTETGAGAALMLSMMYTLYAKKKGTYDPWMPAGIFGQISGLALLLLAPGNRKKLRIESEESDTLPSSLDEMLPGYVPVEYMYTPLMFKLWFRDGFMATIIRELPLQIPVIMYMLNRECRDTSADMYILALEAAALAVPSVMMLSPEYPRRATYPSVIYLMAAAYLALDRLDLPAFSEMSTASKRAVTIASAAFIIRLVSSLIVDADMSSQIEDQIEYIKAHKDDDRIYVDDIAQPRLYHFLASDRSITDDVSMGVCLDNPEDPYNKAAAAYYGVKEIYCGPYEEHVYFKKDLRSVVYGIVQPVKNLVRRMRELAGRNDKNQANSGKEQ